MTPDKTLFQSVIKMIDSLSTTGNYDTIINVLSLLCLLSILNKNTGQVSNALPTSTISQNDNPIQKILGELTKGGGAGLGSPDMLMTLLPLLNNPQIKSKLNPTNIASVMGMINNLGGINPPTTAAKVDTSKNKPEKEELSPDLSPITPSAEKIKTENESKSPPTELANEESEKKSTNRFLNWKTNF
ncbi:MAG: hypothetical protein K0Q53_2229 [Massilibacillus sp.]|jgi:hypothetical protein|nr:hypothetical protein [Massilibacillus sp.]